jgi:transposase
MVFFGIDISKLTFDVTVLTENKTCHKKFKNTEIGFKEFHQFIKSFDSSFYFCMEATGVYGICLAQYLTKQNYKTIVANPFIIKSYSRMQMNRNKTDKADSFCIASYCKSLYLEGKIENKLYKPKSRYYQQLQALVTRLEQVKLLKNQDVNHLESSLDKTVIKIITQSIGSLDRQIKATKKAIRICVKKDQTLQKQVKLLITIDGIAEITAWSILAYLGDISLFATSGQVASFVGLNPCVETSGTSINRTCLSKTGNKRLRKALYMPALVAKKHNLILANFYKRLTEKGKPKKVALCAVMRKLLVLSFAVLKSETAFDPNYRKEKAS